jgi:hypothetical protein
VEAINLRLHRKQTLAYETPATELLYGGAAYSGKSHLMRAAAICWAHAVPGLQIYLFRRKFPDLYKNHMEGPTSFPVLLAPWVDAGYASINDSKHVISIGPHSKIHLCHCQHEKNRFDYQGAEMHVLMVDELTHFSKTIYAYLRGRVRLGGLALPDRWKGFFPRILNGSNPGGLGHNWVKADFVDPEPANTVWRAARSDGGMLRQFIPARMEDNPTVKESDEDYDAKLEGLGDPELVRAMRDGDWNIAAGGMFDDLFNRSVELPTGQIVKGVDVIFQPAFDIPPSWFINRTHDWGDSKPFCSLWHAESNGEVVMVNGEQRTWPRGHLFTFAEDYGWNKVPNVGINLTAPEIARRGIDIETELAIRGRVAPGPGDIPDLINGTSPRDQYARVGLPFTAPDKRPGSRVAGWARLRQLMAASLKQPQVEPGITIFTRCHNVKRTLASLPRDERKREDVATDSEDHAADALRYRATEHIHVGGTSRITWG